MSEWKWIQHTYRNKAVFAFSHMCSAIFYIHTAVRFTHAHKLFYVLHVYRCKYIHTVLLVRISIKSCTCLPEMPGGLTAAGGYYACGANVATKACRRERQIGR